jgi:hypothetical protein
MMSKFDRGENKTESACKDLLLGRGESKNGTGNDYTPHVRSCRAREGGEDRLIGSVMLAVSQISVAVKLISNDSSRFVQHLVVSLS